MISNAVKKMALPKNNKLKKMAGENINSKSSFPRIASIVPTSDPPGFYIIAHKVLPRLREGRSGKPRVGPPLAPVTR